MTRFVREKMSSVHLMLKIDLYRGPAEKGSHICCLADVLELHIE